MHPMLDTVRSAVPASVTVRTLRRARRADSGRWLPWAVAGVFFLLYAALSIQRHRQMLTAGFDLGLFEQAVKAYAHGHAPVAPLKDAGADLLGDHFSPIVAVLAPFYRLFPTPYTLLVAQALLAALAIVPLSRWALSARGRGAALWTALGQGCSWGVVQMVYFDFHEVAFAVPLLACALSASGQRRWRAAALWALPLALVKEDLTLTIAALGLYIACRGPRRLGLCLAAYGVVAGTLEVFVALPALSASGHYSYTDQLHVVSGGGPVHVVVAALGPFQKWYTVFVLLAPTGFLALRSRMALLAVPTLAWRFLADNPAYWGTMYHYSAVLMPIVFAAALDTVTRTSAPVPTYVRAPVRRLPRPRETLGMGLGLKPHGRLLVGAMIVGLCYTAYTVAAYPLHDVFVPANWRTSAHTAAARDILAHIPDGATVASTNRLAAQLVSRTTVSEVCMTADTRLAAEPVWVLVDATDPTGQRCPAWSDAAQAGGDRDGYRLVAYEDSISLLCRATTSGQGHR